jgi:predicted nucleotidyltransferase
MSAIDVEEKDLNTVRDILGSHVPEFEVRAFGSRARGTTKKASDLDLVIMTSVPLETLRMADLKEAFIESDLPFKVDIVDWADTKDTFRKLILSEYIVLKTGTSAVP